MQPFPQMESDMAPLANAGVEKPQPRMLAPGYYSQECNAHKPCDQGQLKCEDPFSMRQKKNLQRDQAEVTIPRAYREDKQLNKQLITGTAENAVAIVFAHWSLD